VGLISCHHAEPRPLSFHQRSVCEQLGQILSLHIRNRSDADELQFRLEVRRAMVRVLGGLTQGTDFIDNLRSVLPELLHFARAGGVAVVVEDRLVTLATRPPMTRYARSHNGWRPMCRTTSFTART
jgi:light-regulated signal transduction histidine kinase (bacteriophytochrome)